MRFALTFSLLLTASALVSACGDDAPAPGTGTDAGAPRDSGSRPDARTSGPCTADSPDTDGDGIADPVEGVGDLDGDGMPNYLDNDSDGDGLLDSVEHGETDRCRFSDCDFDLDADFVDRDSDNDGLIDERERMLGTDTCEIDSDGDGVTDFGEVEGTNTDPRNGASSIDPGDFFVVLPHEGLHVPRQLVFNTDIEIADVYFLIDTTNTMKEERNNLIAGISSVIVPGVAAQVDSAFFGVGGLDDYPIVPYGHNTASLGLDSPYYNLYDVGPSDVDLGRWSITDRYDGARSECPRDILTRDLGEISATPNGRSDLLDALDGLPCHAGNDAPESYVPALWAMATGMGLEWPGGTYMSMPRTPGSIPPKTCVSDPDEPGARRGYPCFRSNSLPIVILIGDQEFHNGPSACSPSVITPCDYEFTGTPSYVDATAALDAIGARVISVYSGTSPVGQSHFRQIAVDTGSVRGDGTPLTFTISSDGTGLSTTIVDAVVELVGGTPQDVTTHADNVPGNPDGVDATMFIKGIVPVEGMRGSLMGAMPGVTYSSKDTTTFYQVIPGTQVTFTVDFHNDFRPDGEVAQVFQARIVVLGNGVAELSTRKVYIVVPPDGGIVLI